MSHCLTTPGTGSKFLREPRNFRSYILRLAGRADRTGSQFVEAVQLVEGLTDRFPEAYRCAAVPPFFPLFFPVFFFLLLLSVPAVCIALHGV